VTIPDGEQCIPDDDDDDDDNDNDDDDDDDDDDNDDDDDDNNDDDNNDDDDNDDDDDDDDENDYRKFIASFNRNLVCELFFRKLYVSLSEKLHFYYVMTLIQLLIK